MYITFVKKLNQKQLFVHVYFGFLIIIYNCEKLQLFEDWIEFNEIILYKKNIFSKSDLSGFQTVRIQSENAFFNCLFQEKVPYVFSVGSPAQQAF